MNAGILKNLRFYFKYKRLLSDFQVELNQCEMIGGVNIALLINKEESVVYRCALNPVGYMGIINNYEFLKNSNMANIPAPIRLLEVNDMAVSAERFIQGRPLKAQDVNEEIVHSSLKQLSGFYRSKIVDIDLDINEWFGKYGQFLPHFHPGYVDKLDRLKKIIIKKWRLADLGDRRRVAHTRIHGDLTFRNILVDKDKILFFDFDRSGVDFPEFDILLFDLDKRTHQNRIASYDVFLDYITQFVRGEINIRFLEDFYVMNPAFNINKQIGRMMQYLFCYRTLLFSLYDLNNKETINLNRFDRILYEINEASGKDF